MFCRLSLSWELCDVFLVICRGLWFSPGKPQKGSALLPTPCDGHVASASRGTVTLRTWWGALLRFLYSGVTPLFDRRSRAAHT